MDQEALPGNDEQVEPEVGLVVEPTAGPRLTASRRSLRDGSAQQKRANRTPRTRSANHQRGPSGLPITPNDKDGNEQRGRNDERGPHDGSPTMTVPLQVFIGRILLDRPGVSGPNQASLP